MSARHQLDWMRTVDVGDVLETANGTQRVVRKVSRFKDGDLRCLFFAIRRCSWTHRPYTLYFYTDLRLMGFRPTGAKYGLSTDLDQQLAGDIADHNRRTLDCCAVKGIA